MKLSFEEAVNAATGKKTSWNERIKQQKNAALINRAGKQTKKDWYYSGLDKGVMILSGDTFTLKSKDRVDSVYYFVPFEGGETNLQILLDTAELIESKIGGTSLEVKSEIVMKSNRDFFGKDITPINKSIIYSNASTNKLIEGKTYLEALQYYAKNPKELNKKFKDVEYSLVSVEDGKLETVLDDKIAVSEDKEKARLFCARNAILKMTQAKYEQIISKDNKQLIKQSENLKPKKRNLIENLFKKLGYEKTEKQQSNK